MFQAAQRAKQEYRAPRQQEAVMAKLPSSQTFNEIIDEALQIHGVRGYMQGHPIEYPYRFGRRNQIAGGTDEVQANAIASVLKKESLPPLAWLHQAR